WRATVDAVYVGRIDGQVEPGEGTAGDEDEGEGPEADHAAPRGHERGRPRPEDGGGRGEQPPEDEEEHAADGGGPQPGPGPALPGHGLDGPVERGEAPRCRERPGRDRRHDPREGAGAAARGGREDSGDRDGDEGETRVVAEHRRRGEWQGQ